MRVSKYIIMFVLLVLLSQAAFAAMSCKPIDGDMTNILCTEKKSEQYNTTSPIINITFPETVTVNDYKMYKMGDLSTPDPQDFLEIKEEYDVVPVRKYSTSRYEYIPVNHVGDGKYIFIIEASNVPNINIKAAILFKINASMMDFWVVEPLNQLVSVDEKPKFAYSNKTIFDIVLETEREVEGCRFSPTKISAQMPLEDAYEFLTQEKFYLMDAKHPIYEQFNGSKFKTSIFVICKEISEKFAYGEIYVGVDNTPPVITVNSNPNPIIDYYNRVSNFTVDTDDRSACKIILNNRYPGSQVGPYPVIERNQSYDFESYDEFMNSYVEKLLYNAYPNPYNYNYTVICTNLANLTSQKNYSIGLDLDIFQSFEFYSPNSVTNNQSVFINGSTTIGGSEYTVGVGCSATLNTSNNASFVKLTKKDNFFVNGRQVFTGLINPTVDGKYTLSVNCSLMDYYSTTQFTLDRTSPGVPNITTSENSCSLEKISADLHAEDALSGIKKYYYNFSIQAKGFEDESIEMSSSKGRISYNIDGDLVEGETYILKAWAEDKAGNIGPAATKNILVTNSSITECDFVPPIIRVNETKNKETNIWTVVVNCSDSKSGCKTAFKYGIESNASAKCNASTPSTLMVPITVSRSAVFCATVYDNNDNEDKYERLLEVNYPLTCSDGKKNGKETDVDCGGNCLPCTINKTCLANADCTLNYCKSGKCSIATCTDNVKNGNETGRDCGGTCQKCGLGIQCNSDYDCQSGNCLNFTCSEPSCSDSKMDGSETDVDCGGSCLQCTRGDGCKTGIDCKTGYCDMAEMECQINPTLDTDKDGLPDVWEEENCNSFTGCDPQGDLDGDGYTNLEEFIAKTNPLDETDFPDYKKYNIVSIILLILGALLILGGATIKVMEVLEEQKKQKERDHVEMTKTLGMIPKMNSISPIEPIIKPRELTEEEKVRGQQARLKALKLRDAERRKIINQFDETETPAPKAAAPAAKEIFEEKTQTVEPKEKEVPLAKQSKKLDSQGEEYVDLSKVSRKTDDAFTKLSNMTKKQPAKEKAPAVAEKVPVRSSSSAKQQEVFEKLKKITKAKKNI